MCAQNRRAKWPNHFTFILNMRRGRPSFHIQARFLSFDRDDVSVHYQLDDRGRLIREDGQFLPYRTTLTVSIVNQPRDEALGSPVIEDNVFLGEADEWDEWDVQNVSWYR
jgi:hypothetical protein